MFDSLIDNLDADKWQEVTSKNQGNWKEYHLNRQHLREGETTLILMITDDNGECKKVKLNNVLPTKDPVQDILVLELALTGDESEVVGIDLNGEIVVRK